MVERTEDGKFHPYVMDFGLARETAGTDQSRSGLIEGTPRYMSPEQARGETRNVDRRTDVYALGVTLYESHPAAFSVEKPMSKGLGEALGNDFSRLLYGVLYQQSLKKQDPFFLGERA